MENVFFIILTPFDSDSYSKLILIFVFDSDLSFKFIFAGLNSKKKKNCQLCRVRNFRKSGCTASDWRACWQHRDRRGAPQRRREHKRSHHQEHSQSEKHSSFLGQPRSRARRCAHCSRRAQRRRRRLLGPWLQHCSRDWRAQ